jgi:hypothetical protein
LRKKECLPEGAAVDDSDLGLAGFLKRLCGPAAQTALAKHASMLRRITSERRSTSKRAFKQTIKEKEKEKKGESSVLTL